MSMRHPLAYIASVVIFSFAVYGAVAVFSGSEETKVRRTINAAILGVELNDPARYGAILAEDYADDQGLTKATLLTELADVFKDYKPFKVNIKRLKIKVSGQDEATANIGFKVYLRKVSDQVVYYEAGKIILFMKKTSAGWRVYRSEYTSSDDLLFIQNVA